MNLIVGAGKTVYPGWISSDFHMLDIRDQNQWSAYFRQQSIDRILAEHVLEHLSESENRIVVELCYKFLKPSGRLRIAVPDGYRPDENYAKEVAPPADGHQILFNVNSLSRLLSDAGFVVTPLEYFDAAGQFHYEDWNALDGQVNRSIRYDRQEAFRYGELYYTSLVVDGIK